MCHSMWYMLNYIKCAIICSMHQLTLDNQGTHTYSWSNYTLRLYTMKLAIIFTVLVVLLVHANPSGGFTRLITQKLLNNERKANPTSGEPIMTTPVLHQVKPTAAPVLYKWCRYIQPRDTKFDRRHALKMLRHCFYRPLRMMWRCLKETNDGNTTYVSGAEYNNKINRSLHNISTIWFKCRCQ